eukprot:m.97578 g.97578  ORF g.97578 m.97578 type:complete len:756 (-) comp15536_c0_seq1:213-2480(-)
MGGKVFGLMSHDKAETLITASVLALACLLAFASRLFAVIRYESVIHEFDPYFNYRTTQHLVEKGFYDFHNWFDDRAWYPLGRIIGGTIYPGLMVTASFIFNLMNYIHVPMDIRNVCVFLAPLFSSFTTIITYLITKELKDGRAGLVAACLIAIVPGYISRSVAGSYDNEAIAIFCMINTYYFWIKAVKTGSLCWSAVCAVAYFYMVSSWGGYVFLINLIPLHVLALMAMGRFNHRIYVAFSAVYVLGTLLSMQISFVGFQPTYSSEHMAALGTFGLCQIHALVNWLDAKMQDRKQEYDTLIRALVTATVGILVATVGVATALGKIAPWTGRFYSMLDPTYAKNHIPIIASVSEHQPTTWVSFFNDLHVLSSLFPAGLWFVFHRLTNERVFIVLYAVSAVYFAGVMVRLMLTLAPIVVVCASICISHVLDSFLDNAEPVPDAPKPPKRERNSPETHGFLLAMVIVLLSLYTIHCVYTTQTAYSSPSVVLSTYNNDGSKAIIDDFREAYFWLWQNTKPDSRVMSWWDYGYQIAGMGNRTTLVDNNTWNNSHIAMVGMAMSSNETRAYEIMRSLDVDYVLVIFGGLIGYSGDDINKFLWMVRIGEGEHPDEIHEPDYFTPNGEYRIDSAVSDRMKNCLMYKLSYYRFGEVLSYGREPGYDRTRNAVIGEKNVQLTHLEEAYTSENWLVRIYRVLPPVNRKQVLLSEKEKQIEQARRNTGPIGARKGTIKDKLVVQKPGSHKSIISERDYERKRGKTSG